MAAALLLLTGPYLWAGEKDSSQVSPSKETLRAMEQWISRLDSTEAAMDYMAGTISLNDHMASLTIPKGYKFIGKDQARFILEELWENLPDERVLGMIVPENFQVNQLNGEWAFVVSYDNIGFVKDKDADDINYEQLLQQLKTDEAATNMERERLGYNTMNIMGWAAAPYYDREKKILHWAKEFRIQGNTLNTLNYEVKILGRKGLISLNAVGTMEQFPSIREQLPRIIGMVQFNEGHRYADFESGVDVVGAWNLGSLVVGKVMTNDGILQWLLSSWKYIGLGMVILAGIGWRQLKSRKDSALNPKEILDMKA